MCLKTCVWVFFFVVVVVIVVFFFHSFIILFVLPASRPKPIRACCYMALEVVPCSHASAMCSLPSPNPVLCRRWQFVTLVCENALPGAGRAPVVSAGGKAPMDFL